MRVTRVVHCRREAYDVYIGRPGPWGNPYRITSKRSRAQAIQLFRDHCKSHPKFVARVKKHLTGKTLGCFCDPLPCHGHIYVEICNGTFDSPKRRRR